MWSKKHLWKTKRSKVSSKEKILLFLNFLTKFNYFCVFKNIFRDNWPILIFLWFKNILWPARCLAHEPACKIFKIKYYVFVFVFVFELTRTCEEWPNEKPINMTAYLSSTDRWRRIEPKWHMGLIGGLDLSDAAWRFLYTNMASWADCFQHKLQAFFYDCWPVAYTTPICFASLHIYMFLQ